MAPATETRKGPPSDGGVSWAISPQELEALNLPTPELVDNRYLAIEVDGKQLAVGVFALPPTDSSASKFWKRVKARLGINNDPELPPARLRIEPPIPPGQFQKGDHTRLSAMHPYVVMEDGTKYAIGVLTPHDLIGDWSEPKVREDSRGLIKLGETETFREKPTVALLIRLDGETPLHENVVGPRSNNPVRRERYIAVNEAKEGDKDYTPTLVAKRVVTVEGRTKADISDLTFHVITARGTAENAQISNNGLVQVVVVKEVDDQVIERGGGLKFLGNQSSFGGNDVLRSYGGGLTRGMPDSTVVGRTQFEGTTRRRVSEPVSIREIQPVAVFNLVLVGNGGPITAEMTEAPAAS